MVRKGVLTPICPTCKRVLGQLCTIHVPTSWDILEPLLQLGVIGAGEEAMLVMILLHDMHASSPACILFDLFDVCEAFGWGYIANHVLLEEKPTPATSWTQTTHFQQNDDSLQKIFAVLNLGQWKYNFFWALKMPLVLPLLCPCKRPMRLQRHMQSTPEHLLRVYANWIGFGP